MRNRQSATTVGMNLGSHQTLVTITVANHHKLAGSKLRQAVSAQGFHVNENVFGAIFAGQKTVPFGSVKPFNLGANQITARLNIHMGSAGASCEG